MKATSLSLNPLHRETVAIYQQEIPGTNEIVEQSAEEGIREPSIRYDAESVLQSYYVSREQRQRVKERHQQHGRKHQPTFVKYVRKEGETIRGPISILFFAFLLAWFYTIMPCDSYWFYFLFKNQYWGMMSLALTVELMAVNLPEISDFLYVLSYIIGAILAPITHIIRYYQHIHKDQTEIASWANAFSYVSTVVIFGYHAFVVERSSKTRGHTADIENVNNEKKEEDQDESASDGGMRMSVIEEWAVMIEATGVMVTQPSSDQEVDTPGGEGSISNSEYSGESRLYLSQTSVPSLSDDTQSSTNSTIDNNTRNSYSNRISQQWQQQSQQSKRKAVELMDLTLSKTKDTILLNSKGEKAPPMINNDNSPPKTATQFPYRRYFFFLPRYFLSLSTNNNKSTTQSTKSRQEHNNTMQYRLWFASSLFVLFYILDYTFLIYFTRFFRSEHQRQREENTANKSGSNSHEGSMITSQLILFFIYIVVGTFFRMILKSLGLFLDRHKFQSKAARSHGQTEAPLSQMTVSMFFVGEVMGLMFYYTFYRVLFESIHSVIEFLFFQTLHLTSEWVLYVIRASPWYHRHSFAWFAYFTQQFDVLGKKVQGLLCGCSCCSFCVEGVQTSGQEESRNAGKNNKCESNSLTIQSLPHRTWQEFVALDFGIRCAVFIATAYGMTFLLLTINVFPYVRRHNGLRESTKDFNQTLIYISVAMVMEFINATAMNRFYFQRHGLNILEMVRHCFALKYFALLTLLIGTNLFINPIFAFTKLSFTN